MRMQGKIAIVTGGASGIGEATVRRLAAEGAKIVSGDLSEERGQAVIQDIKADGADGIFVHGDVSTASAAEKLITAAVDTFGGLDSIVCAAGIAPMHEFVDIPEDVFDRVWTVNLKGPFHLAQAAARYWIKAGIPGSIVNITSVAARQSGSLQGSYSASKGALEALTRVMAVSLAPYNIRANAVAPGATRTNMAPVPDMWENDAAQAPYLIRVPLQRFADPDEQARMIVFLASDEASYVTGETVHVDGGRMAFAYTVPVKPEI